MARICHAHCPDDSGALLAAVLAVILTAALAAIAAQVIESLFVAIAITGGALIAAGTGLFVWLVRRDRIRAPAPQQALTGRVVQAIPAPRSQAISAPRRVAEISTQVRIPGRAPVSRSTRP